MNLWSWLARPERFSGTDKKTYEKGRELMASSEKRFRQDADDLGVTPGPAALFQARLFGANFAVSAMTLCYGEARKAESEAVYKALYKEAGQGLGLKPEEARGLSTALLKEQTRALIAEMRNVGSGQFALAALYETALESSAGAGIDPAAAAERCGRAAAEMLGHWAALYAELGGKPMQTYALGFKKSARDSQRLGDA
ncbi:MAG TPA: hypothetical protein VL688_08610 [Verrucomicrobiae bacterium]|jgi:hypothetical protein|nr:hypothetical protein [Verrucomicrobiae bacterium]